eukprot:COSAG02_NODE_548_length_20472_cov_5.958524_14_plen_1411_part_00
MVGAGTTERQVTPRLGMQELRRDARKETEREAVMPVYYTSRELGSSHPATITRTAAIATPPRVSQLDRSQMLKPEREPAMPAPLAASGAEHKHASASPATARSSVFAGRMQQRRTGPEQQRTALRDTDGYVMSGLEGLRRRIADELVAVERECGHLAEFDHARLEKHGNIFNRLLGSFKIYAPLFAKIKSVYDRAIDERLKAVARTKPKEVMLNAISGDGFDLNLQSIHDTYHRQTKGDRTELAKLRQDTEVLSTVLAAKQAKLDAVLAEEKQIKDQMSELDDWQHTLIQSMRSWEKSLQELHMQADANDNSVWKKGQDITKAKDKISNGMSTIERKMGSGGDLEEKKSELVKIVENILKLHQNIQVRTADVRKTSRAVKEARTKLEKMETELLTQKELAVDRKSAVTPIPDWEDTRVSLEKVVTLDISKQGNVPERKDRKFRPSADIITSLTDRIAKLSADIVEAKQDVLQEEMAKMDADNDDDEGKEAQEAGAEPSEMKKTKWLVCKGRGDNVPTYLRATGRVKNKNFSRQQVLAFLNDYWIAKDATVRSRSQPTADFLASYVRNKHGTGRTAVEWIYNLIYALKVYSTDPDCDTFNCILLGELPEDAYHGQRIMVNRLLVELKKADKQNHGGRMWGTLDRTEFAEVLRRQFPLKSEDDFKALRRAVATDQPLPDIRYGPLLEKNADTGLEGKFLESLREQYISDVQQTYPKVEAAIRKATLEENERTQKVVQIEDHQTYPYLQLLKQVPFFHHCDMTDDELKALILEMDITEYHDGDIIIPEGSPAEYAFVLEEGTAYATKESVIHSLNCNYQVGDFFGELGLKQGDPRAASIIARAGPRGVCRCIRMSAAVFNKVRVASAQNEALLHQRQMQYFMATKMASVGTRNEGNEGKESNSLVTSVKCVRQGLAMYDPEMPEKELNRLLHQGIGVPPDVPSDDGAVSPRADGKVSPRASGAVYDDEMMVSLASFMSNIRRTVIKRFAKPPEMTEAQRRTQFLRNISDTERERMTECFNELDDSGDGTLDQEEIEGLLKRIYGMEPSKKQMAQLMLEMDSDGNGVIDLDEFISAMATVKEVRMAGDIFKWRQTFDRYDEDQSGELSGEELKKMTSELWDMGSHSLELMQFMIEEADVDGDGQIDWPEFCQMMQRMMDEDEKKLEMKRQHTIIAAQSADTKATAKGDEQQALDRGGMVSIVKHLGGAINLGLSDHPDAVDKLWKKVDYNASNSATFSELQNGMLSAYPQLLEVFQGRRTASRVIMRAYTAADIVAGQTSAQKQPLEPGVTKTQQDRSQGDGVITRLEFPRFLAYVEIFANLWGHFETLDGDDDGKLDLLEFKSAFHDVVPKAATEKHESALELDKFLEEQFAQCDNDRSGYCSFDEFSAWIAAYVHDNLTDGKKSVSSSEPAL